MDALEFLKTYGQDEAIRVAEKAGTNIAYFRQIAYGHRKPSPNMAWALVDASDDRMSFLDLLPRAKA